MLRLEEIAATVEHTQRQLHTQHAEFNRLNDMFDQCETYQLLAACNEKDPEYEVMLALAHQEPAYVQMEVVITKTKELSAELTSLKATLQQVLAELAALQPAELVDALYLARATRATYVTKATSHLTLTVVDLVEYSKCRLRDEYIIYDTHGCDRRDRLTQIAYGINIPHEDGPQVTCQSVTLCTNVPVSQLDSYITDTTLRLAVSALLRYAKRWVCDDYKYGYYTISS